MRVATDQCTFGLTSTNHPWCVERRNCRCRPVAKGTSRIGQLDVSCRPLQQLHAKYALKMLYRAAERRLRDIQFLSHPATACPSRSPQPLNEIELKDTAIGKTL